MDYIVWPQKLIYAQHFKNPYLMHPNGWTCTSECIRLPFNFEKNITRILQIVKLLAPRNISYQLRFRWKISFRNHSRLKWKDKKRRTIDIPVKLITMFSKVTLLYYSMHFPVFMESLGRRIICDACYAVSWNWFLFFGNQEMLSTFHRNLFKPWWIALRMKFSWNYTKRKKKKNFL